MQMNIIVINTKNGYEYGMIRDYQARHANRPTPRRPHRDRSWWDKQRFTAGLGTRPPVFGGRI